MMRLSYFFIFFLVLSACARNKANTSPDEMTSPQKRVFFVKGNPLNLIAETTPEPSTPFFSNMSSENTSSDIMENEYILTDVLQFSEKYEKKEKESLSISNSELKNKGSINFELEGSLRPLSENLNFFRMKKEKNDNWLFSSGSNQFIMRPDNKQRLQITEYINQNQKIPVQSIHFSCNQKCQMMSFMGSIETSEMGIVLFVLYWRKNDPVKTIEKINKEQEQKYDYLFGPNDPVIWNPNEIIELSLCGREAKTHSSSIKEAMRKWAIATKNAIKLKFKTKDSFPPFSDLNTHCLQFINNYLLKDDPKVSVTGLTVMIRNQTSGYLEDGDMLFFKDEWDKLSYAIPSTPFMNALIHEGGHFFGLAHPSDKKIVSKMSYQESFDRYLTDYDQKAIQYLYH